jgi:hypothetical protein
MPYADPEAYRAYQAGYREEHRTEISTNRKEKWARRTPEERQRRIEQKRARYATKGDEICKQERDRQAKLDPASKTSAKRMKRYKISQQQYDEMFRQQNGLCALCAEKPPVDIDHCHDAGHVRGLLCRPCNLGLGMFKDSPELLLKAIDYLKKEERLT